MYIINIYKNNYQTIYKTLYGQTYNETIIQATRQCAIFNSLQSINKFFIVEPVNIQPILFHTQDTQYFANKWLQYPEYVKTVKEQLNNNINIINTPITLNNITTQTFKIDFEYVYNSNNTVKLDKNYFLEWLINNILYCLQIETNLQITGYFDIMQAIYYKEITGKSLRSTDHV